MLRGALFARVMRSQRLAVAVRMRSLRAGHAMIDLKEDRVARKVVAVLQGGAVRRAGAVLKATVVRRAVVAQKVVAVQNVAQKAGGVRQVARVQMVNVELTGAPNRAL